MCLLALGLPYAWSPIYRFPPPAAFSGASLYNPYRGLRGAWKRANLHAHGAEWGGLTNGQQPSDEVMRTYRALGYDVAGVSNYHAIAAPEREDGLALYEHGYNVRKRHQLAVGARGVEWFDFPLWQGLSQEQFIIDRIAGTSALVGLTHPVARDAYTPDALQSLTGYHLIEIVNGPFESYDLWDAALSSGRVVWAMANDDTHDTRDPRRTAAGWNMIDAPSTSAADLVAAMRQGSMYAVGRRGDGPAPAHDAEVHLADVTVTGDTVHVGTLGAPADIEFIGHQGRSRGRFVGVHDAEVTFERGDTYIRAVVDGPGRRLYLNPVLRYDGRALPAPTAVANVPLTWGFRAVLASVACAGVALLWPRRQARGDDMAAVVRQTDRETA